jgi:hypothetical protein
MTDTCDWSWRVNSFSTSFKSPRIGSKSWASATAEALGAVGFKLMRSHHSRERSVNARRG